MLFRSQWAVTTSGTEQSSTWWHEASQSNCFAVNDLEKRFGAKSFNSQNAETILDKYHQCKIGRASCRERV